MSGSQKDDADHLAAYAEKLLNHAGEAMAHAKTTVDTEAALGLVLRARMAIREAQAQIK